jgi:hypothetical protein
MYPRKIKTALFLNVEEYRKLSAREVTSTATPW